MKQAFIFPGLLATAMAAALPVGDLVPEFTDAPFDLAQLAVEAPLETLSSSDDLAVDAEYLFNSADAAADDTFDINVDGEAAWLKIQSDIAAELDLDQDAPAPAHAMKWSGLHMTTTTGDVKNEDGVRPGFPGSQWPVQRPSWWPGGNETIPDFHYGITADGICEYLQGAYWKVNELRRPAEQLSPEYVPWLVWNKGPYYYVLEGLREIEWVLLRIGYLLKTTSGFTEEEQFKIIRCHIQFAGYNYNNINPERVTPLPTGPGPVRENPVGPRQVDTAPAAPARTSTTAAGGPEPTRVVVVRPRPGGQGSLPPRPVPWQHRFGLKDLLTVILDKHDDLEYQTYALKRVERVIRNFGSSYELYHDQLLKVITNKKAHDYLMREEDPCYGLEGRS